MKKKKRKHSHKLEDQSGKDIAQVCLPAHLCWEKLSRNQAMQCSGEDSGASDSEEDCYAHTLTPRPGLPLSAKLTNWISAGLSLSSLPQSFYQPLWPYFVSTAPQSGRAAFLKEGKAALRYSHIAQIRSTAFFFFNFCSTPCWVLKTLLSLSYLNIANSRCQ